MSLIHQKQAGENYFKEKRVDEIDTLILLMIGMGGNTCSYLSAVLNMAKSSINYRINKLAKMGFVELADVSKSQYTRPYQISETGRTAVFSMRLNLNLFYLSSKSLSNADETVIN